jgi:hypothetical protein
MTWRYKAVTIHGHARADSQGHVLVHVLVAETALGHPLPKKAIVHHVDEDPSNNANRNLVICQDQAYHKLLHVRANIVRAGGHPDTENVCTCCRLVKPLEAFSLMRKNKSTGRRNECRPCSALRFKRWLREHRRAA